MTGNRISEPWNRRVDTRRGDSAHGITFVMHERKGRETRAEVAIGARKAYLDARVSLTLALDQYRYGDELIAQLFTRNAPRIKVERHSDEWNRVQIFLGTADIATAEMLEGIAREIRARAEAKAA